MSTKKNTEIESEEQPIEQIGVAETVEQTDVAEKVPKFTIQRLRKDCYNIFGVTTSTFDGAVFGLDGEYTVEEMRRHIDAWRTGVVIPIKEIKKEAN